MKEICLDEGTIQAFLDGELGGGRMETAARHIALCGDCALLLSQAEEESAFAYTALGGELNTLVPTHRLWSKINDSLVEEKRKNSLWNGFLAFAAKISLSISNPAFAAAASLLIVAGLFAALFISRPIPDSNDLAVISETFSTTEIPANEPAFDIAKTANDDASVPRRDENLSSVPKITKTEFRPAETPEFTAQKIVNVKPERKTDAGRDPAVVNAAAPQYLPGEETYLKTIAGLTKTVENQKDTVLKPSTRFVFERDLAVIDDAIEKMKTEVRKNPKNEAAKEILYASYQNKINLLNSVTERTELIASLR